MDCAQPGIPYACTAGGVCARVDCLQNADCGSTGLCEASQHKCVSCLTDADCAASGMGPRCGPNHKCVACTSDGDCAAATSNITGVKLPRCSPGNGCVECISNAECTSPKLPRCDGLLGTCEYCNTNADCAAFPGTSCMIGACQ